MKQLIKNIRNSSHLPFVCFFLAAAVLPLFVENDFYLDGFILIFIWASFSSAWNIIAGFTGMVSLGHNALFGIGAYSSTILLIRYGISPWFGLLIGGTLAAAVGVLIGVICFRLRSHYFALATLAFGEVIFILAMNFADITGGAEGIALPIEPDIWNMSFQGKLPYVYSGLILLMIVTIVSSKIKQSKLGYFLIAFKENEDAARMLGVNTGRARLTAMAISSFLAAVTGSFYAQYIVFIDPSSVCRIQLSIQAALFAIVGGIGTVFGPIVGAVIFVPITIALRAVLGSTMPGLHLIIYGFILIVVLLYMPQGILGAAKNKLFRISNN